MRLWLARSEDGTLSLFGKDKPVKFGKYWVLGGSEEGDCMQLSLNSPFNTVHDRKYFEEVREDKPLAVSLVPNKTLAQCGSMSNNMECALQKLHFSLKRKDAKAVCDSMDELERLSAQAIELLNRLNTYKEE